ncbi:MAG TPA: helix-turn-helix transcriptional regulator [Arachidicoccus soli]|uniref:XRE family transcriptional regulator n=1 Tax=Arachidicoccus soli TaxID=2341117 RepID=A0A386HUN2_9BACT|nr:helix-turn-helix transcriptional regulator [Arachidicoccus soli]AYD49084.1 XRE family transcriptional regulator [Arachidicoccus soli]HEU0228191.1 helix-turn-helix transcriptional regulator [Arachidicoccus soli]
MANNYFSINVKFLRKGAKLTQAELFKKIGFKDRTWSNYETGVSIPNLNDLIKISKYFGVSLDDLIFCDLSKKEGRNLEREEESKDLLKAEKMIKVQEDNIKLLKDNITLKNDKIKRLEKDLRDMETYIKRPALTKAKP